MSSKVKHGKNYVRKTTFWDKKNNKKVGVILHYEDGYSKTLLNPYGKSYYYASDIKGNCYTDFQTGALKTDGKGNVKHLTKSDRSYRRGYLDARKDSAAAYKAKHK